MKTHILLLAALFSAITAIAQNYDPVKTLVMLNQIDKAKTDIDKAFGNAKYTTKPEAFILKSTIYSTLANNMLRVKAGSKKEDVLNGYRKI